MTATCCRDRRAVQPDRRPARSPGGRRPAGVGRGRARPTRQAIAPTDGSGQVGSSSRESHRGGTSGGARRGGSPGTAERPLAVLSKDSTPSRPGRHRQSSRKARLAGPSRDRAESKTGGPGSRPSGSPSSRRRWGEARLTSSWNFRPGRRGGRPRPDGRRPCGSPACGPRACGGPRPACGGPRPACGGPRPACGGPRPACGRPGPCGRRSPACERRASVPWPGRATGGEVGGGRVSRPAGRRRGRRRGGRRGRRDGRDHQVRGVGVGRDRGLAGGLDRPGRDRHADGPGAVELARERERGGVAVDPGHAGGPGRADAAAREGEGIGATCRPPHGGAD